jgi:hypothetical protein
LKGTKDPISVYTISDTKVSSAFRIMETEQGTRDESVSDCCTNMSDWLKCVPILCACE